jgi:hypothetical protein
MTKMLNFRTFVKVLVAHLRNVWHWESKLPVLFLLIIIITDYFKSIVFVNLSNIVDVLFLIYTHHQCGN